MNPKLSLLIVFVAGTSLAQDPVPPSIRPASSEAQDAVAGFDVPSGWRVSVAAAEPQVANIVAFDIDRQGQFWVCETFRQDNAVTDNRAHDERWLMADLAAMTVADRVAYHQRLLGDAAVTYTQQDDRIRRLQDTDGDGVLDQSQVYVDGFNRIEEGTGAGVLAHGGQIYYTCIPHLWQFSDTTGDGRANVRESLAEGFGVRVAFRGHDMHGLIRGPDGRLYFSIGDRGYNVQTREGKHLFDPASGAVFRCEMDGSGLEVFATGLRNPQELAFDDYGNLFTGDNNSDSGDQARWVYLVRDSDTGWRMSYQYLSDRGPFNREKIWHPFHDSQPAYIVPPVANISDGPSGLTYYPGTGLGNQWRGRFLLADFRGSPANSGIRSFRVEPEGAFFKLVDAQQPIWKILATDVAFGPDGAVYVSDWVDGWVGEGKGRIYRFADTDPARDAIRAEVAELLGGDWQGRAQSELVSLLGHADRRIRLEAQWELADRAAAEPLRLVASERSLSTLNRLHGLWGLGQIARGEPLDEDVLRTLEDLLFDSDAHIQAAAAEVLGAIDSPQSDASLLRAFQQARNPRAQHYLMMALADRRYGRGWDDVVRLLDRNANRDPILRHAGVIALAALGTSEQLSALRTHNSRSVRRAAVVALRRQRSSELAVYLDDREPLVVLEAARAINDVPIEAALPPLAQLIRRPTEEDALMRRVLNANFRIGNSDCLRALVQYAADPRQPLALRLEALAMLQDWKNPDPRDRVVNLWRPLKSRSDTELAGLLRRELSGLLSAPEEIAGQTIRLATQLGMVEIAPRLSRIARDDTAEVSARRESLLALRKLDPDGAIGLARSLRLADQASLRRAALIVLSDLGDSGITSLLRDATGSKDPAERGLAWDLLGKQDSADAEALVFAGVRDYIEGKLPADVWLNVLEASDGKRGDSLQNDLRAAQRAWAREDPLAHFRASAQGGDPQRGRDLFFEKTELSCVRCHRVNRQGGQVGPVLTTIGATRDRTYILEALVRPDATIAKGYETAVIADDFGQAYTGIVREEDDESLRLIQSDGTEVQIEKADIVVRRRGKSAMPEDLVKQMSARELRDLVAYLVSLKVDPRAENAETE